MWELDIMKVEHWGGDAFELWCWRRLLRVPWTERRSNQSVLKEINPEYWLEELMLTLNLQYFGHLMWRADSLEKTLMLGNIKPKVITLLSNTLSMFVVAFLPRGKCLLISWLQSPPAVILEPKKIKSVTVSIFLPSYLPWSDGTRCHDLSFLNVSF